MANNLLTVAAAGIQFFHDSIVALPQRSIDGMKPQLVIEEVHTDDLQITEHPVEQGARITDHAYKRQPELSLRYGWSNSPSNPGVIDGLLSTVTGTISGISSLLSGSDPGQINAVYAALLTLQEDRRPFTVFTGKRVYDSMLITSLRITTDKESEHTLMVSATLKQILIVTTQTLIISAAPENQADPSATAQPLDKGVKSLIPATNFNLPAYGRAVGNPIALVGL